MFCYKCGKQLPNHAVFCSRCGTKQTNDKQQSQASLSNNTDSNVHKKKELTIEAVENALLKNHKTEDRITLLKVAGDAYASGDIGAPKDSKRAIEKYKEAMELGSVECEHAIGVTYIYEYCEANDEDADFYFSLGIAHVCWSYKKGYAPARDTLQFILDKGTFPNCRTIEDILKLSELNI